MTHVRRPPSRALSPISQSSRLGSQHSASIQVGGRRSSQTVWVAGEAASNPAPHGLTAMPTSR